MGRRTFIVAVIILTLIMPTGAGAVGWFDLQHGQGASALNDWAVALNIPLETPVWFPWHYEILAPRPVLIVSQPQRPLLNVEVAALEQYVQSGGILFLVNDPQASKRGRSNLNQIMAHFGAVFNQDVLMTEVEGVRSTRYNSRFTTDHSSVWCIVQGIDTDLNGLALNNMSTISFFSDWDVIGYVEGDVQRWSDPYRPRRRLPEIGNVVFAARQYGQGAVIAFGNTMSWSRPVARRLLQDLYAWGQDHSQSDALTEPLRDAAFAQLFELQLQVENRYRTDPTLGAALAVERGWSAYIDGHYQLVGEHSEQGFRALASPPKSLPRPPMWLLAILLVGVLAAGLYVGKPGSTQTWKLGWLALAVSGLMMFYLALSLSTDAQWLDYSVKVLVVLALFAGGAAALPWERWAVKCATMALLLCIFYVGSLPQASISDRVMLKESMIFPDSAPVRLLAAEFSQHWEAGTLSDLGRYVENFISLRIFHRLETVDLHMTPVETLRYMEEDCDGQAILAASIIESMGHPASVAVNYRHAWPVFNNRGYLKPEARYLYLYDADGVKAYNFFELLVGNLYILVLFLGFLVAKWPDKVGPGWWADFMLIGAAHFLALAVAWLASLAHPALGLITVPLYILNLRLLLIWDSHPWHYKRRLLLQVLERMLPLLK